MSLCPNTGIPVSSCTCIYCNSVRPAAPVEAQPFPLVGDLLIDLDAATEAARACDAHRDALLLSRAREALAALGSAYGAHTARIGALLRELADLRALIATTELKLSRKPEDER